MCMMCGSDCETSVFALLDFLRNRLFDIFVKSWSCPMNLSQFLFTKFRGFGSHKEVYGSALFMLICVVFSRKGKV